MSGPNPERRSERARRAILGAALELCREQPYDKVTMEGIAKRAGVGKQTIYRWWPSKAAILLEAIDSRATDRLDFPDTGELQADLRSQMTEVVTLLNDPGFSAYKGLIAAAQSDPDIARSVAEIIIKPRERHCVERLVKAQEVGQLRADVDPVDVVELLYAPLYYRLLMHTRPVTVEQLDTVFDLAFNGLTKSP